MNPTVLILGSGGIITALLLLIGRYRTRARLQDRLFGPSLPSPVASSPGVLTNWLARAGFRRPGAARLFVSLTLLSTGIGGIAAWTIYRRGEISRAIRVLGEVPGGIGDLFLPAIYGSPWLVLVVMALLPWLLVRLARSRRVKETEEDLPIILELLASLGEGGLGFDTSLDRVLSSQNPLRPLTRELRLFQTEIMAGRSRRECLRRLARRVDVPALTVFLSAVGQALQSGASLASVLRRQADDLRQRRREKATERASALPVKLLVPLIVCFLPGVSVATLGPTFFEFFRFVDQVVRTRGVLP